MVRRRKKKALYEVMSRTRPTYGRTLGKLHPEESGKKEPTTAKPDRTMPKNAAQRWRKPRIAQFNAGRVEISIPYQLAIALLLGFILLILVAFRLGQIDQKVANSAAEIRKAEQKNPTGPAAAGAAQRPVPTEEILPGAEKVGPAELTGDNVIVLVQYKRPADLVPVRQHFAEYGIETEIVQQGGWYFLITKDRFEDFEPGTKGHKAKQKIVEVGAKYAGKAPEGYETFAPHFFRDAYGKKVR